MQIAAEWNKHGSQTSAAAALLGKPEVSDTERHRFLRFIKTRRITWRNLDFYGPPDMDMYDIRINKYEYCVKTLAKGKAISDIVNEQLLDESCAKTGLGYVAPASVQKLAANIMGLNQLPDKVPEPIINEWGVIEQIFDPELLRSQKHLFHVRRCLRCRLVPSPLVQSAEPPSPLSLRVRSASASAQPPSPLASDPSRSVRAGHVTEKRSFHHGGADV